MSIRSFVAFTSVMLSGWLVVAFIHTPVVRRGGESVSSQPQEVVSEDDGQADDLAVSVSP